jgi:hypothetical protein
VVDGRTSPRRAHSGYLSDTLTRLSILAAVVTLGLGVPSADAALAHRDLPLVPAQSARAFGDSMGVDVRLTYLTSSYKDFNTIEARLKELGVRYVGDGFCPTCEYQITRLQRLAADGIRANLGVGNLAGGTASIDAGLRVIKDRLRNSVISVTTINEPDISGNPNWIADTRWFTHELYTRVNADPALANLEVIGPALVNRGSRAALGDISGDLDRGNIHPYPGGAPPLHNIVDEFDLASKVSADKPLVATEIGYHTDTTPAYGGHYGASERAVAQYMPRIALEAFVGGIERTYIYQFADLWSPSQAQQYGVSKAENSFGLLRWDLSPKPSFIALRNLLRVVDGDSAPVASPDGMRLRLEGAGPDVQSLLLRSADGTYALALWRRVSVWDYIGAKDLYPAPDRVDVVLGQRVSLARRFDPVESSSETKRWDDPSRIPVDLAGAPIVLRLTPASAAGGGAIKKRQAAARRRAARSRCGSALASSLHARKHAPKKRRAVACCKSRHAKHGRAHRRKRATWRSACVSFGRRR